MGEKVTLVRPDGTVIVVDREVAESLTGQPLAPHVQTPEEATEQSRRNYNREHTTAVEAGVVNAANTALFGLPGMVGLSERNRAAIEEHPTGAKIGALAAVLAPTGLLGRGAKAVSEGTFLGQAAKIGQEAGFVGRAVEGGIIGGGLHMADASLSDDPLSAEALVESIGMGSLLSVGLGAATDKAIKLISAAKRGGSVTEELLPGARAVVKRGPAPLAEAARARAALDEAEALAAGVREEVTMAEIVRQAKADVEASRQALDELPEYAAFRDSYNSAQQAIAKSNKLAEKTAADFAEWAKPSGLRSTLSEYEGVQGKLRSQIQKIRAKDPTGMLAAARRDAARAAGEVVPDEAEALFSASREIEEVKAFSKNLVDSTDPRAANAIYSKMQNINTRLTELGVKTPKLPDLPTGEVQELGAALPDTLTALGKMKPESIAKIANALDANSQIEAVNLARSIGLDAETAGDALVGINRQMKEMYHTTDLSKAATREAKAIAEADAKAAKASQKAKFSDASVEVDRAREVTGGRLEWTFKDGELAAGPIGSKGGPTLLSGARKWTKAGIQAAAARAAYSGGWKGALVSRLAYGAAGYAVGGVDGALLGASVGSARAETLGRVRQVVVDAAKHGVTAVASLRPLAAYLGTRGAAGESANLYDGVQARNLIDEVHQRAITSHDAMYSLSKGVMGMPGDVAFKLYDKTTRAMAYLSATAPKDPGIDVTPTGTNWEPSPDEIHTWLHRYEATMHPVDYAKRVLAGDGDPAGIEALQYNWPILHQQLQSEAVQQDWSKLSSEQATGLSMLFGRPVTGANDPDIQMMIQAQYMSAASARSRQGGGKRSRGTGNPNGRPPAVQSPVAGSSVTAHTLKGE